MFCVTGFHIFFFYFLIRAIAALPAEDHGFDLFGAPVANPVANSTATPAT